MYPQYLVLFRLSISCMIVVVTLQIFLAIKFPLSLILWVFFLDVLLSIRHVIKLVGAKDAQSARNHRLLAIIFGVVALVHRVADFVADLKQDYPDKKVLVVCHGLTIRGFFAAIFHAEMDSFVNVGNVTVNEVHLDENDGFSPRLYSFNRELVSADDFFNR